MKRHFKLELSELFGTIDTDKSGTIETVELLQAMVAAGERATRPTLEKLLSDTDENEGGVIDRDEFAQMMAPHLESTSGDTPARLSLIQESAERRRGDTSVERVDRPAETKAAAEPLNRRIASV